MSGLAFLLIVVVVVLLGWLVVWIRHRKPTHFMSSVDDFQREMDALGRKPGPPTKAPRRTRSGPSAERGHPDRGR